MKIYLVRHGEAVAAGGVANRDAERKLTARGEAAAKMMGQVLAHIDPDVRAILTSPLARAVQTGKILRHELYDRPVLHVSENLSPGFRPKSLLDEILLMGSGSSVVAVGHQPDLSQLIGYLIADSQHVAVAMTTLAIAGVELDGSATHARAQLSWLLTPETVHFIHSLR
jgi:phosphohistidine phosphatase